MPRPVITLLTDFGENDHYVAAMKGAILGICPEAQLVDVSHGVTPFQILEGAYLLSQAWRYFPPGTVHLVVVDPGVGGARRPILAEAGGHRFVAPDNGVLDMALEAATDSEIREITARKYFRRPVSRTFHGRDIFAPVAAHLASGISPASFGKRMEDRIRLGLVSPLRTGVREWAGAVLHTDRFGNIVTNFSWAEFSWVARKPFSLQTGRTDAPPASQYHQYYADAPPGEPFVVRGSGDFLEVSLNQANAAIFLRAATGDPADLRLR